MAPARLPVAATAGVALLCAALAGCGNPTSEDATAVPASVAAQSRPIGAQARFHPPAPDVSMRRCTRSIGAREAVHVELFAHDRVVVVPAGIGAETPRRMFAGRVVAARCYGDVVTLEPTGVALVRPGAGVRLADLFRAWRMPLTPRRLAGFAGHVRVYLNGRARDVDPRTLPLSRHDEIVLEVGAFVPPHRSFLFPRGS
jgi:hypothetical protein